MFGRIVFHHHAAVRALLHVLIIGFGYVEGAVEFRANSILRLFHEGGKIEGVWGFVCAKARLDTKLEAEQVWYYATGL